MLFEFTIHTRDSLETTNRRLYDALASERPGPLGGWLFSYLLGAGGGSLPNAFRGEVGRHDFWLIRNISWFERSFPAKAKRRLSDNGDGTTIHVRIVPRIYTTIFFTLWLSFPFGLIWHLVLFSDHSDGIPWQDISFLAIFIAGGMAVMLAGMIYETSLYRMGIKRILLS